MPSEQSQEAVTLIVKAYEVSGLPQQAFGSLLKAIARDFEAGRVHEPERAN
ncbi:hypothetical protein [Roseibium sediminis]|uniref:hypothetical protein n=1 Tax=Roseibium sediminis TaxID=1775174 RepID=UPI001375E259|nr:hypothetical protein [Roseibium sediminis]